MPPMSNRVKTKTLLTYHCGCHGNLVTIAMRHVADACHPKEPPYHSIRHKTKELLV